MSSKQFPLPCTKSCSNVCFFSRFLVHQIVLQCALFFSRFAVHQMVLQCVLFSAVCRAPIVRQRVPFSTACRVPERAPMRAFFRGLPCTKSCSNACFFAVCHAPNRAPMRAFFPGLSCAKSCSNACFFSGLSCAKSCCMVPIMIIMLKVRALVTLFFRALKMKQKRGKTKNGRFRVVFLFEA